MKALATLVMAGMVWGLLAVVLGFSIALVFHSFLFFSRVFTGT